MRRVPRAPDRCGGGLLLQSGVLRRLRAPAGIVSPLPRGPSTLPALCRRAPPRRQVPIIAIIECARESHTNYKVIIHYIRKERSKFITCIHLSIAHRLCSFRFRVKCDYCGAVMMRGLLGGHQTTCSRRPRHCGAPGCGFECRDEQLGVDHLVFEHGLDLWRDFERFTLAGESSIFHISHNLSLSSSKHTKYMYEMQQLILRSRVLLKRVLSALSECVRCALFIARGLKLHAAIMPYCSVRDL